MKTQIIFDLFLFNLILFGSGECDACVKGNCDDEEAYHLTLHYSVMVAYWGTFQLSVVQTLHGHQKL